MPGEGGNQVNILAEVCAGAMGPPWTALTTPGVGLGWRVCTEEREVMLEPRFEKIAS